MDVFIPPTVLFPDASAGSPAAAFGSFFSAASLAAASGTGPPSARKVFLVFELRRISSASAFCSSSSLTPCSRATLIAYLRLSGSLACFHHRCPPSSCASRSSLDAITTLGFFSMPKVLFTPLTISLPTLSISSATVPNAFVLSVYTFFIPCPTDFIPSVTSP